MTSNLSVGSIPGYIAGTWTIDPVHSDIAFSVRHMMVSKVRGNFRTFEGEIVTPDDPSAASVTATIDLTSIDTSNEQRDADIRSADFFDVDQHQAMTYRSTVLRQDGDRFVLDGELTLHGITKSVPLALELNGFGRDPMGGTRVGFTASGELSRKDFGITFNMPIDGGGVVISDRVDLSIEIEAVLNQVTA